MIDTLRKYGREQPLQANICLIPYDPALYPTLAEQVSKGRVLALFKQRGDTRAIRYDLPLLPAFTFLIDGVEKCVNTALNLDGHGKSYFFRLPMLDMSVPAEAAHHDEQSH